MSMDTYLRTTVKMKVYVSGNAVKQIAEEIGGGGVDHVMLASALNSVFSTVPLTPGGSDVAIRWDFSSNNSDNDSPICGTVQEQLYRGTDTVNFSYYIAGRIITGINDTCNKALKEKAGKKFEELIKTLREELHLDDVGIKRIEALREKLESLMTNQKAF